MCLHAFYCIYGSKYLFCCTCVIVCNTSLSNLLIKLRFCRFMSFKGSVRVLGALGVMGTGKWGLSPVSYSLSLRASPADYIDRRLGSSLILPGDIGI